MQRTATRTLATLLCFLACGSARVMLGADAEAEAGPIRVVVWDERQPEQKQAYENFLGNAIADGLGGRPGIEVRSVGLDDAEAGLAPTLLDWAEVLVWWSHKRNKDVPDEPVQAIVEKVFIGLLLLRLPFVPDDDADRRGRDIGAGDDAGPAADKETCERYKGAVRLPLHGVWLPAGVQRWWRSP